MGKGIHKSALPLCKMQDAVDIRLRQLVKERMVGRFVIAGIFQCPACVTTVGLDLEVGILPCRDAPVDLGKARLKLLLQCRQVLLNRLLEHVKPYLRNQRFFVLPLLIINEIVLYAPKPDTVAAKDIASFQAVAELAVEETFVAILEQLPAVAILFVKITLHLFRHPCQGNILLLIGSQRLAASGRFLKEADGFDEGIICCRSGELDTMQHGAEIDLHPLSSFVEVLPLECRLVESRVGGQVCGYGIQPGGGQHGKGFAPYLLERRAAGNATVREELEYLSTLQQVLI